MTSTISATLPLAPAEFRTVTHVRNEIAEVQGRLNASYLRPLAPLADAVARWTARATINPGLRGELAEAIRQQEAEEANHAQHNADKAKLAELQKELAFREERLHLDKLDDARKHIADLNSQFDHACMQVCRLYEQLVIADRRFANLRGYRPVELPEVDFKQFTPSGWQGTTAEHIRTGSLQWLNNEKDKAA